MPPKKIFVKASLVFSIIILITLGLFGLGFGTLYATTQSRLAYPKIDHFHFRFQYIFRGQAEDFGAPRYQIDYLKDICNGALSESPIHFHDKTDQLVHLHWRGITGGDILKFYGNNSTGGLDNIMGYKLDQAFNFPPKITQIPIYGNNLPKPQGDDKYFIYTGEKDNFQKKNFEDFKSKTLEEFLGKNSKLREQFEEVEQLEKSSFQNPLSINAKAHDGENHATPTEAINHDLTTKKTDEELKQINNLIGNVVIFIQSSEPTNDQVKTRFDNLVPLNPSVCGG